MVRVGDSGLPTRTTPSSGPTLPRRQALFAAVVLDPDFESEPDDPDPPDDDPLDEAPDFESEPDEAATFESEPDESDDPEPDDDSPFDDAPDSDEDDEVDAVARLSLR
jgi:ATP-dependent DNA helicase UvrD/PcrA